MTTMQTADPEAVGLSSARLALIPGAMQRFIDAGLVGGVATIVARHGKIVHAAAAGLMDLATSKPMQLDTIFRIHSMSKPITAAASMCLLEEGRFELDDPVADFIPEFAHTRVYVGEQAGRPVLADLERPLTIRHLLTHTSGLTYGFNPAASPVARLYAEQQIMRVDESLAAKMPRLAALPLMHQPGAAWTYGMSIDVLGRVAEVVTGQPFDQVLRSRLFDPLAMPDTGFRVPAHSLDRLATLYAATPAGLRLAPPRHAIDVDGDRRFLMGGGGLVSTLGDYARFAQMLLGGGTLAGVRVLGRKAVELMTASQMTREQIPFVPPSWPFRSGYGMALGVRTVVDLPATGALGSVGSFTWQGAAGTDFWVDPAEDLLGVSMIQVMDDPSQSRLARTFRTLVYQALS